MRSETNVTLPSGDSTIMEYAAPTGGHRSAQTSERIPRGTVVSTSKTSGVVVIRYAPRPAKRKGDSSTSV